MQFAWHKAGGVSVGQRFPSAFLFGAATAAYQVEGAVSEDGRKPSIWDVFAHSQGKTFQGHTGDKACDQYHRYHEDVRLLKELGLHSYRFSISWPRIFPEGKGKLNSKGMDYYRRLVEELLRHEITPLVTLYHWDLPYALENQGGWLQRDTMFYFAEYAQQVVREFAGTVHRFLTINEPSVVAYEGYLTGNHAPGHSDLLETVTVAHHLMAAHAYAVEAIRAVNRTVDIGIALNLSPVYPADPEEQATAITHDRVINQFFLDAACKGRYPKEVLDVYGSVFDLSFLNTADLQTMARQQLDFLGVNYYFPTVVTAGLHPLLADVVPPREPLTDMGWSIDPNGLYDILMRIHKEYPLIPIYITENGAAFADQLDGEKVNDTQRIAFLQGHLQMCERALEQGVDLRGYYVWSLLDNFEWGFGYSKRFGIVYVDFATMRRIPKASAYWLRDFIVAHSTREA